MSNPFATGVEAPEVGDTMGVRVVRVALIVGAVAYLLLGLVTGGILLSLRWFGADGMTRGDRAVFLVFGVAMPVMCTFLAGVNLAPLLGLRQRAPWAWATAFGLSMVYLPSAFFPIGLALLWGLLNEKTRREFLGA